MNAIVARLIKKGAREAAMKVFKYLKDDQRKSYALEDVVRVELSKRETDAPWLVGAAPFASADGCLEIYWDAARMLVAITAFPFPSSAKLWNGPDIIPDKNFAAMYASLFHDLIWGKRAEIAAHYGVTGQEVLHWGNAILDAIWRSVEPKSWMRRAAFVACEVAVPWYHRVKRLVGLGCIAAAFAGCTVGDPSGWTVVSASGTNAVVRAMRGGSSSSSSSPAAASGTVPDGGLDSSAATPAAGDSVDFADLSWSYGGFKGGSAVLHSGCRIADLRVTAKGLSYKWAQGGCEALGATSRGDTDHTIACLFVQGKDGSWSGGKIDWISTSRTTRDFANVRGRYHGWPTDAIETATAYAFVIVSKDGRRRSNVITCGR